MNIQKHLPALFMSLFLTLSFTSSVQAAFIESSDAGDSLETALTLDLGTDLVLGDLNSDVDMYRFSWGGGNLGVNVVGQGSLDPLLFLFNEQGQGLLGSDDFNQPGYPAGSAGFDLELSQGIYYIALTGWDGTHHSAVNRAGNDLFLESLPSGGLSYEFDVDSTAGALSSWRGSGAVGRYMMEFSKAVGGVVLPNFSSLLMFVIGVVALVRVRAAH